MNVVPAVRTPITAEHARDALLAAMPGLDREAAALLLSLVWVETGRGGSMFNWNAGNISCGSSYPGDAWRPPWFLDSENAHLHALHEAMLAGKAPAAFRAYSSATEGFADFARQLKATFPTVLAAASSGDPAAFVRALHDSGYSRDYTPAHIQTFVSLRETLGPLVAHLPPGHAAHSTQIVGVGLALAAAGVLFMLAHHGKRRRRRRHHHRRELAHA